MAITVYTKPSCVQCTATTRALNKYGLEFTEVDLVEDADALATIKSLGYQQAPVIFADGDHWAGYRPDKIKALVPAQVNANVSA
ncbi:glutaredoxin-like protein NrdH [Trueperella sp.]|uniref:glutaredoxin-like protein NrdH n=1 Tax=Trueperella sp. TaxID=2699835 RepID=UPI0037360765